VLKLFRTIRSHFSSRFSQESSFDLLVSQLIDTQEELNSLPQLSGLERAKLEQDIAIEHLYYSSKIEGTNLTEPQIQKAIHSSDVSISGK
jgi:hypothetical protein